MGRTTPCCRFTESLDEIRANPQHFDCSRCEHLEREQGLMAVNARALTIYGRLCGRTAADLGLTGRLFEALTERWSTDDVVDLVERLELIRSILDPPRPHAPNN